MNIVTIPKKLASSGDLVVIPRKEYETIMKMAQWKRVREFTPIAAQKRALRDSRREHRRGDYLTLDELKRKLGLAH